MTYQEMDTAIREAEAVVKRAELYRNKMARFLIGRLHGIDTHVLRMLKKELTSFNAQTGMWKEK
mgnify:FL=1